MLLRVVALAAVLFPGVAGAALAPRLGGTAVYDTTQNVTFLADASGEISALADQYLPGEPLPADLPHGCSQCTPVISSGTANWFGAEMFVSALNRGRYLGFDDWRLPRYTSGIDNASSGELGTLLRTELGGVLGNSGFQFSSPNAALFVNLAGGHDSWWVVDTNVPDAFFGSPTSQYNGNYADGIPKSGYNSVWVVRTGDVAPVPLPAAGLLLGVSLVLVAPALRHTRSRYKDAR